MSAIWWSRNFGCRFRTLFCTDIINDQQIQGLSIFVYSSVLISLSCSITNRTCLWLKVTDSRYSFDVRFPDFISLEFVS